MKVLAYMQIREISEVDIDQVVALLTEGFKRRSADYWRRALSVLATRPVVGDLPRFGHVLEVDGVIDGVILVISSQIGLSVRRNLSSWYVRDRSRKFSIFLFKRAIRETGCTYLNLSPSKVAQPIASVLGFRPYTRGAILIDARTALQRGGACAVGFSAKDQADLPERERDIVARHLDYGCSGILLRSTGPEVALYRIKWLKGRLPSALFVYGRVPALLEAAPSLMRVLASRGILVALMDAPAGIDLPPYARLLPEREIRFVKGPDVPEVGDLHDTEIALFGP